VALPLSVPADELELLRAAVPQSPVILSMAANAKEYGG
jgi:hypothetical protein